jgi:hypothetical protein
MMALRLNVMLPEKKRSNLMKPRHLYYLAFAILFLIQSAHFAEHVAQLIQIYGQGIKPPEAHGLLGSVFDFEWVHFVYNISLEVTLIWLWFEYRRARQTQLFAVSRRDLTWLSALVLFQGYHSVEHFVKLYQYLFIPKYQSGVVPTPGILPEATGWPIFLVHFGFNLIVWATMAAALWRLYPPGLMATMRAALRSRRRLLPLSLALTACMVVLMAIVLTQGASAADPGCGRVLLPLVQRNSGGGGGGTAPDFTLTVEPNCLAAGRGETTPVQVRVTAQNGFTGTVTFSLDNPPAGFSGTFNTPTVNAAGISTLGLNVGKDVALSSYVLTVKGVSGGLTRQAVFMVFVVIPPPVSIARASPADGESEVAVTRETIIEFSWPISSTGVTTDTFSAQFGGQALAARVHQSPDRRRVTLFYEQPLPASARVRVTVNGDNLFDNQGRAVDVDGDGLPGGVATIDFDTLSLSRIAGTDVWGYVYDSYNKNPDNSDRPVISATIRVDGFPEANAVTDQNGYFILHDMPAPIFFVHIDGSTATNAPPGTVYATVGKPFHSVAGQSTQLVMDGETFHVYLPPMSLGDTVPLSSTQQTVVGFGPAGEAELIEMFPNIDPVVWDQTLVTFLPNSAMDDLGNPATEAAIIPVPPDRIPAPLPPNLRLPLVISVQAVGANNFDTPAPVCFPNLPDPDTGQPLAPGEKSALVSFNHDTGMWEVAGSMTVSADGKMVCTNPGVGIRAPGWHGTQPGAQGGGSGGGNSESGNPCVECVENIFITLGMAANTAWGVETCLATGGVFAPACFVGYTGALATGFFGVKTFVKCSQCFNLETGSVVDPRKEALALIRDTLPIFEEIEGTLATAFTTGNLTIEQWVQLQQALQRLDTIAGGNFASKTRSLLADLSSIGSSVSADFPPPGPVYYAAFTDSGVTLRNRTSSEGQYNLILGASPNGALIMFFDPINWTMGFSGLPELQSGQRATFPDYLLTIDATTLNDTDGDGLPNVAEFIIGTDFVILDTDGDGITDGAEVQQGTDPLDGIPAATGIIASADTPGTAVDIAAFNDIAIVADSDRGVSVLSIVNGTSPVIIAQVDTPGNAQAVAFSGNLVAVADGTAGLSIIDITDPPAARIVRQISLPGAAGGQEVATAGNLAYVASGSEVVLIDLLTGTILDRHHFSAGSVNDLAVAGDFLYVLTAKNGVGGSHTIHKIRVAGFLAPPIANLTIPGTDHPTFGRMHISAGGGLVYVGAADNNAVDQVPGVEIIQDTDAGLSLIGQPSAITAFDVEANGSGLTLFTGADIGLTNNARVALLDVRDPTRTDRFLTAFDTPGAAAALSIYNGLVYVADQQAGLQVINYLPYDSQGQPPTITLSTNFTSGFAEEGKQIRVSAIVSDDVQVRNVEFYVDGVKAVTDGNFPFEHRFTTPLRSQQPSFTLRAKATDTGGNLAWTDLMTVTLTADATPPFVDQVLPEDGSVPVVGSVSGVSAIFNEPISSTLVTTATLRLFSTGPDGNPGTPDDVLIMGGILSYRDETNTVLLNFSATLIPDYYRAVVSPPIIDLAGNPLATEFAWTFRVKDPVYWISGTSGVWNDPNNWSTGSVPGPTDVVIINRPASNITVTHGPDTTSILGLYSAETLVLSQGSLTINDTARFDGPFILSGGVLSGIGDVIFNGLATWTNGTMSGPGTTTVAASSTLTINNSLPSFLDGRTLNNAGMVIWNGTGDIRMSNGALINNLAGAVFDAQNNATFGWSTTGAFPTFNNAGLIRKSAGGGATAFNSVAFSGGNVEVLTGTLSFGGADSTTSGGNFAVAAGAVLDLVGGAGTHTYGGNYTGSGEGTVRFASGVLRIAPSGATFNFGGNLFQWTGGILTGTGILTNTNVMNLSGTASKELQGLRLNNAGAMNWSGTGSINMSQGAAINNLAGGIFDILGNANMTWGGGALPVLNNAGTFRKLAGAGTTTFGANITFTNLGSVTVQTGTLAFQNGYSQITGTVSLNGGDLASSVGINIQGGSLSGVGIITSRVTVTGVVSPGGVNAAGVLTITGNYVQAAAGALNIELGGLSPAQYDRLAISGSATLSGTLNVSEINGFTPSSGQTFQVMTFGARNGVFTAISGPYAQIYTTTDLTVQRQ